MENAESTNMYPSVASIKAVVTAHFGLACIEMVSRRRARRYARPRQIAMMLARDLTPCSYPEIGREFGNRDHTTVMHAVQVVEKMSGEDAEFAAILEVLRAEVLSRFRVAA